MRIKPENTKLELKQQLNYLDQWIHHQQERNSLTSTLKKAGTY